MAEKGMNILQTGEKKITSSNTASKEEIALQVIQRARRRVSEWKLKLL